jgi:HAE1 family hydrophobic/amphiphilic exporter-1
MWLTRFSMRRPVTLVMALASVAILGVISFSKLPLAFLPQVEFPFIGVWVPYPGGIPSEIEREISRPIEEILATLGGVREVESRSDEGEAWIDVEFEWGRDVNVLRMEVQEKIDQIRGELPSDIQKIFLFTFNSNDIPVIEGRISAKGRDLSESYDLIEQKIIMPLQQIPGVGQVGIDGVNPTVGAIYLRLDKIQEFNVDVGKLFDELAAANINLSVGQVTDQGLRYVVRTVSGIESMRELGKIPIDERGLRLEDIAKLVYAAPAPRYGRHLNGEFAIAFWIQKASGFNTVDVCRSVEARLEEINLDPSLQGIDTFTFFNQAEQIEHALDGLWKAGLFGSLLAMIVLFAFLRKVSLTLLVCLSIPMSILGTGTFLYLTGGNLNILTMMGLMLGIGMLVDNAVVVLESINRRRNLGASPVAAALRGTRDVGRAIVASTLTTVIVFAPIIVGRADELTIWLGQVGMTIGVTIVCSLFVSLTVIPTLSVFLSRPGSESFEPRWIGGLRERYLRVIRWTTIRHPYLTGLAIVPLIAVLTGGIAKVTGAFNAEFMGDEGLRQERLRVRFDYLGDVQMDKKTSKEYVERTEEYLETRREELGLRDIYSYYGPGYAGMSLFFHQGELSADFVKEVRDDLRENLPVQAGLEYEFGDEEGNDSGVKQFTVTLFGEDTELLSVLVEEAERRLEALEGISDVGSAERGQKEILVAIDRDRASRRGVRASTISQVLGLTYRGTRLPRLNTGKKEIDLSVSLLPDDAETIENRHSTTIAIENGAPLRARILRRQRLRQGARADRHRDGRHGDAARLRVELRSADPAGTATAIGARHQHAARDLLRVLRHGEPVRVARAPRGRDGLRAVRVPGRHVAVHGDGDTVQPDGGDRSGDPDRHRGEQRNRARRPHPPPPGGRAITRGRDRGGLLRTASSDPDDRRHDDSRTRAARGLPGGPRRKRPVLPDGASDHRRPSGEHDAHSHRHADLLPHRRHAGEPVPRMPCRVRPEEDRAEGVGPHLRNRAVVSGRGSSPARTTTRPYSRRRAWADSRGRSRPFRTRRAECSGRELRRPP